MDNALPLPLDKLACINLPPENGLWLHKKREAAARMMETMRRHADKKRQRIDRSGQAVRITMRLHREPMNEYHYGKKTGLTVCAWVAWFLQYLTVPASCRVTTSMTRRYPYIESSKKAQNILTELMAQNVKKKEESDLNTFSQMLPTSAVTQRTHAVSSSMGAPVRIPKGSYCVCGAGTDAALGGAWVIDQISIYQHT
ncbi:hypothetical protein NA56DRAFT_699317 [Hyaloscypha hepaticicola]|uniref:Uncharacterized protein n=1 Tax=Hyaloscypha hepaticicola TaxID=2082293 RepID=A0A2J6QGJ3_9HELO|nr:hypothetical protein NA56DRAFT_699317 [Hyaloscypha hepaticicola]